jgi:hypothetical protein
MLWRVLALVLLAVTTTAAQRGGGALMGARETAPEIGRTLSFYEQLADLLDLDARTQVPEAEKILTVAAEQAGPVARQMQQLRIQLVNAEIGGAPDDAKKALEAYLESAVRMAEIEADAFTRLRALLKPSQEKRLDEAFAIMAGIFIPPPPPAGTPAGRRGGGAE